MKKIKMLLKKVNEPIEEIEICPTFNRLAKVLNGRFAVRNNFIFDNVVVWFPVNSFGDRLKDFNCKIKGVDFYGDILFICEDVVGNVVDINDVDKKIVKSCVAG